MASPKKYRVRIARVHARVLWLHVQSAKSQNRTHEDWLSAANRELFDYAEARVSPGGGVSTGRMDKPGEEVEIILSFDAVAGVKLAVVQHVSAPTTAFRDRQDTLEAIKGFGEEFVKVVMKAAKLPENNELDEDAELEGVPSLPETKFTPVLVEPTKIPAEGRIDHDE